MLVGTGSNHYQAVYFYIQSMEKYIKLTNIADQYVFDENVAKASKKTAGVEQVLQKLVKA